MSARRGTPVKKIFVRLPLDTGGIVTALSLADPALSVTAAMTSQGWPAMGALDAETLTLLLIVALAAVAVLGVVSVLLVFRVTTLRRQVTIAFPQGPTDAVEALARQAEQIATIRDDVTTVHANAERLHDGLQTMISRVGLVRYDAFDDVAGAQSFSAALLDLNGDGLVISAINGRQETRCYGKQVSAGKSQHTLSEEEATAITSAIEGRDVITLPQSSRKRRSS